MNYHILHLVPRVRLCTVRRPRDHTRTLLLHAIICSLANNCHVHRYTFHRRLVWHSHTTLPRDVDAKKLLVVGIGCRAVTRRIRRTAASSATLDRSDATRLNSTIDCMSSWVQSCHVGRCEIGCSRFHDECVSNIKYFTLFDMFYIFLKPVICRQFAVAYRRIVSLQQIRCKSRKWRLNNSDRIYVTYKI